LTTPAQIPALAWFRRDTNHMTDSWTTGDPVKDAQMVVLEVEVREQLDLIQQTLDHLGAEWRDRLRLLSEHDPTLRNDLASALIVGMFNSGKHDSGRAPSS
jgi:hypothetical protein